MYVQMSTYRYSMPPPAHGCRGCLRLCARPGRAWVRGHDHRCSPVGHEREHAREMRVQRIINVPCERGSMRPRPPRLSCSTQLRSCVSKLMFCGYTTIIQVDSSGT
eukprot:632362-Pelagomonas_calceolata.AAC.1